MMRGILPAWTEPDPALYHRLGDMIDPGRKVLAALERIVPLSGKRIADVGTGIGHYPMLLARRTARTYGIESDPSLLGEARLRASAAHQPNIRMVEGEATKLPLRDAEAAHAILPRLYGDRARAFLMSSYPPLPELKLGLYHLAKASA